MAAGLSAMTAASPAALIEPAKARPWAFALFSLIWNAAAWAAPGVRMATPAKVSMLLRQSEFFVDLMSLVIVV